MCEGEIDNKYNCFDWMLGSHPTNLAHLSSIPSNLKCGHLIDHYTSSRTKLCITVL
jgi:hypothetical protein